MDQKRTHAVLGLGAVGSLIGAALARAGHDVIGVVRPETVATRPATLSLRSPVLGDFATAIRLTGRLDEPVDTIWVTCRWPDLRPSLAAVDDAAPGARCLVPLLNGIDHVEVLRRRYPATPVIPAAIRTSCRLIAPGQVSHGGWHLFSRAMRNDGFYPTSPVQLSASRSHAGLVREVGVDLSNAGIASQVWPEGQVIWQKVTTHAPWALASAAAGGDAGTVRGDRGVFAHLIASVHEVVAVASALGTALDVDYFLSAISRTPDGTRFPMERDLAAGRPLEIGNVADPVIREGDARAVPVPSTRYLRDRVLDRLAGRGEARSADGVR